MDCYLHVILVENFILLAIKVIESDITKIRHNKMNMQTVLILINKKNNSVTINVNLIDASIFPTR